jgi:predicted glycogen debranching enzyme
MISWRPHADLPAIAALTNGSYEHAPMWYRNFLYREEAARGLDDTEDLASPGTFSFELNQGEALVVLRAGDGLGVDAEALAARVRELEAARRSSFAPLDRAAESFIVRRGRGHTIIAGFPWFVDWGRDTFIAMRGLCIARGRRDIAGSILTLWTEAVSQGMLPNRFPEQGEAPEFNSVDASLWYVIAVHEFLAAARPEEGVRGGLVRAVTAILDGYAAGTRYAIRMDSDGLIACGTPGTQLTWMDARVGDRAVTPRIGKPVEIQALWINALRCAGGRHAEAADRAQTAFRDRFWRPFRRLSLTSWTPITSPVVSMPPSVEPESSRQAGCLCDRRRRLARTMVATVERRLLTPMGLRSPRRATRLLPAIRGWRAGRDSATAGDGLAMADRSIRRRVAQRQQRRRGAPGGSAPPLPRALLEHLRVRLGHVSEIADGDVPHTPRGCPFQAWSLGELIRAVARTAPLVTPAAVPPRGADRQ